MQTATHYLGTVSYMDQEVGLGPGDIVSDEDPAPPRNGGVAAPTFRPTSIVAKRLLISATAEVLLLVIFSYWEFVRTF